ncbi:MAG: 16S rRNA (adenine(1518)-N(6)/adenine(1519)-N(6))-dimethyltransferase RsmA [Firmicutes bacterium]|nr:16S rRNA (adenine(1518)-N(6)/adenine(1519)-N(6))-dimethyltransferase RsmA [Bacillota bacterium]
MERFGIRARKSLGQNFLIDGNIIRKIVDAAGVGCDDAVVEIGPGLGALTATLARRAKSVIAVEIDRGLIPVLTETLAGAGQVRVFCRDALKTDFDALVEEQTGGVYGKKGKPYKLLANLPYYITSPLIMHLLTNRFHLSRMVVMVQLEVAARLAARPGTGDYGALTVAVNYFTSPALLFRVPRTVFYPVPAVDSAVVRLDARPEPPVAVADESLFFKIVRASFGQRRKTILNALAGAGLELSREARLEALDRAGIDAGRRGETLSLEEFAALTAAVPGVLNRR